MNLRLEWVTACLVLIAPIHAEAQDVPQLLQDALHGSTAAPFVTAATMGPDPRLPTTSWSDEDAARADLNAVVPALLTEPAVGATEPILLVQGSDAQSSGGGGDLAAKSQNPISDLVSLPLQSNWDYGINPRSRTRYVGNLQPVVPVKLNDDWNLINRIVVPFVNVPVGPDMRSHGIGDMIGEFFFSPRDPGAVIWGIGPAVLIPTASDPTLGIQEWGAGVNFVALVSQGPVVAGALMFQIWGVEGTTKPFLFQPFFNYNLPRGWYLNVSGEATADWELPSDSRWTFPLGAGVGRVFPIFGQPLNVSVRFAPFLERPTGGPDWQFRLSVTMLFPK